MDIFVRFICHRPMIKEGKEMMTKYEDKLFKNLLKRTAHQNWKIALFLFTLTSIVRFTAVPLNTFEPIFWTMILYVIITLILVRKQHYHEIRLRRPANRIYILKGLVLISAWFLSTWILLYLLLGFSTSNWFVMTLKPIITQFGITKHNAWQLFPLVVLTAVTISPIAEELFFRGLLLKSFEYRLSAFSANLFQGFLFGFIHLTHFGLNPFDPALIITMMPTITLAGIIYGWAIQKADSILSGTIIHAFNNFLIFLFIFAFIIPVIW